jgi:glutaredoxin 3
MDTKRKIEIFSAGCPACDTTVSRIRELACPSCEIAVLNMNETDVAARAKSLGIGSVPAVVIDGKLADCCAGRGPDEEVLKAAGLGTPLS